MLRDAKGRMFFESHFRQVDTIVPKYPLISLNIPKYPLIISVKYDIKRTKS